MTEQKTDEPVDAFYGFQYKKRFYVVLCQDGKPSQIGVKLVEEITKAIKQKKLESWKRKLLEMKIVFEDNIPTEDDLEIFQKFLKSGYDGSNWTFLDEYYIKHRSLEKIIDLPVLLNSISPQGNPYVAPYGYVLNFDDQRFDIYIEHARISSLEDRYGTLIPVLKEKLDLNVLNKSLFQRVIDQFELGIEYETETSNDGSESETDFETSHSEKETDCDSE